MTRMTSPWRLGLALTMVVLIMAGLAGPAWAEPATRPASCDSPDGTPTDPPERADVRPVVLVHGWTGGSDSMRYLHDAVEHDLAGRAKPYSFDYWKANDRWAGDPAVADCLAVYVATIAKKWRTRGGDGRVLLVGYSMGGLAIRYASTLSVDGEPLSTFIGGVVTLDTPHRGSPWAGWGAYLKSMLHWRLTHLPIPPYGSSAGRCLVEHDDTTFPAECHPVPPYLPDAVPVHQISGQVTFERTFWAIPLYRFPLNGDGIVPTTSQEGYVGSAAADPAARPEASTAAVSCTMRGIDAALSIGAISSLLDRPAFLDLRAGTMPPAALPLLSEAGWLASCGHSGITRNADAIDNVIRTLRAWLDERPPTDGVPLYQLNSGTAADGPTGQQLESELGGRTYPDSTGMWVGCGDAPATATYKLDGGFRRLTATAGLHTFTPDEIRVHVEFAADGAVVLRLDLAPGRTVDIDLAVAGVDTLEVAAQRTAGECTAESLPYGSLGDAVVLS